MSERVAVDPTTLGSRGAQMLAVADQVHAAVEATGATGPVAMKPTLDRQQSLDRIERHVHDAVAPLALGAPTLTLSGNTEIACDNPHDGGPKGRIALAHSYDLDAPSPGASTTAV